MSIIFRVVGHRQSFSGNAKNTIVLHADNWDDFKFKTSFSAIYYSARGEAKEIGNLKIGYIGQQAGWTVHKMEAVFSTLSDNFFSLGQDVEYYKNLYECLAESELKEVLAAIKDVVSDKDLFSLAEAEAVFKDSLLRSVSISVIQGQFQRVLRGAAALTEFRFRYSDAGSEDRASIILDFEVMPDSSPPSNIHVIIGRNGVGKTTIINNIVSCALKSPVTPANVKIQDIGVWSEPVIDNDYFSSLVSVSFSAFDPFNPPVDRSDRTQGIGYFYVGMKRRSSINPGGTDIHKSTLELIFEFIESLEFCLREPARRARWERAIRKLESDDNFRELNLTAILSLELNSALAAAHGLMSTLSSGHSIILLTITRLVQTVEEKTLVLLDEPESHLHPPLLSAFVRAIEDLLISRNGLAIIATHSPVVVQEVPASCVWIVNRVGTECRTDRPERETFGENVGILTREVFGLEVSRSGFHGLLKDEVEKGLGYSDIVGKFENKLGQEARAVLQALISARDSL